MSRARSVAFVTALVAFAACDGPVTPTRVPSYGFTDFDGLVFHWPTGGAPVRFWVNPGDSLGEYVTYAIAQWEPQFLYGEFHGVLVDDSSRADVIVQVAGPPVPTGPIPSLADSGLDNVCSGLTEPDQVSDDGRAYFGAIQIVISWVFTGNTTAADSTSRVRCLARVVTHEMGHSLGLQQHSTDAHDIMFTFPRVGVPSERDRAAIQRLFNTPSDITPPVRLQ